MKLNNAFENVNLGSSVVLHLINMGWFVLFWCNSSCKLLWLNFDPWICFNDYVSLFPRTNCTPNHLHSPFLLSFPTVWTFLKLLFVSLTLSLSCPMTRSSSPFLPPIFLIFRLCVPGVGMPLLDASYPHLCQIAREAEAAMFHRQVFEDLRRSTPHCTDHAEAIAIGAVEASFKSLASGMIVLTGSGR